MGQVARMSDRENIVNLTSNSVNVWYMYQAVANLFSYSITNVSVLRIQVIVS